MDILYNCVIFFLSVYLNSLQVYGNVGNVWGYSDGLPPQSWPRAYPECGGKRQSPINIHTASVEYEPNLQLFDLRELRSLRQCVMTIQNHGKTVEIDVHGDHFLHGGSLPGRYKIKQFHFHWGTADKRGSEHDLNGRQYPMEMHIVSYNTRYSNFHDAANSTGGISVLSFLIEIGNDENRVFEDVCHNFATIIREDQNVTIENFELGAMFPQNVGIYYRYYGSLTTPPCHESVMWTVFRYPIIISKSQIDAFRVLGNRYINQHQDIKDNFRPLQALHGRKVYTNNINGIYPRTAANQPRTITRTVTSTRRRIRLLQPNERQILQRQMPQTSRRLVTNANTRNLARARLHRRPSSNNIINAAQFRRIPNNNVRTANQQRRTTARSSRARSPNTRNLQNFNKLMQRLGQQIKTEVNGINNGDQAVIQRTDNSQRTRIAASENKPLLLLYGDKLIRWSPSSRGITRGRLLANNQVQRVQNQR